MPVDENLLPAQQVLHLHLPDAGEHVLPVEDQPLDIRHDLHGAFGGLADLKNLPPADRVDGLDGEEDGVDIVAAHQLGDHPGGAADAHPLHAAADFGGVVIHRRQHVIGALRVAGQLPQHQAGALAGAHDQGAVGPLPAGGGPAVLIHPVKQPHIQRQPRGQDAAHHIHRDGHRHRDENQPRGDHKQQDGQQRRHGAFVKLVDFRIAPDAFVHPRDEKAEQIAP